MWGDVIMRGILASLALLLSGCTVMQGSPVAEQVSCSFTPCDDVCVILVEATPDLGNWGKLPEIACYVRDKGLDTVYFDPDVNGRAPEDLAACIRYNRCVRGKRILLVCWSYSTVQALDALDVLACEGLGVETMIDIECLGLNIHKGFDLQPSNASRVVVVRRTLAMVPKGYCNPVVVRLDTPRHLQAMCCSQCLDTIFREAYRLCYGADLCNSVDPSACGL